MGVKAAARPPRKPAAASKRGTATDAPQKDAAPVSVPSSEPDAAFREAMGDSLPASATPAGGAPQAEGPEPPRAPRGPVAKVRAKRKYTRRDKAKPIEPQKAAGGKPAPAAAPRGQQAAGFAVAITVMHMGLAARVPEMALRPGEAEQLGAALDGVCKEFGYKPSTKAAALLTLAGTAFMVYAPKVAAVRANRPPKAQGKAQTARGTTAPPEQAQAPQGAAQAPEMSPEDWEAVELLATQAPRGDGGGMH